MEIVIAECFLIKHHLTNVGGASPHQAVFGRAPPLLPEFELASVTQLDDQSEGLPGVPRGRHRL